VVGAPAWSTSKTAPGSKAGRSGLPVLPTSGRLRPLHHKVMVTGQAVALRVRAMTEVPVHLDDLVLELAEANQKLAEPQRHHLVGRGGPITSRSPHRSRAQTPVRVCAEQGLFVGGDPWRLATPNPGEKGR
jgi:hypothetical protein